MQDTSERSPSSVRGEHDEVPAERQADGARRRPPHDDALHVRVYTAWDELEDLRAAWERLLGESRGRGHDPTIFSTPEWLGEWWKAYGVGKQLVTLAITTASGELVGLAPLYREELRVPLLGRLRRLRLVGDGTEDSDNLDLIFRAGREAACCQALLGWLGAELGWDVCELNTLPADSPNMRPLRGGLAQRGWRHVASARPSSAVDLPGSWAAYLEQLSNEHASGIARYTRRLHRRYAVRIFKCSDEAELPADLEALFDLHQKRWIAQGEPGSFAEPERRRFYREMGQALLRRSWLEFWLLALDGQIAAAEFDLRYGDTVYQLQAGLDPAHHSDRIGHVLRAHVLQQLIAQGVRRYDFLGGIAAHKQTWGAQPGSYTDLHFARPLTRGALYLRWCRHVPAARRWLQAHTPRPVYARLADFYHRVQGRWHAVPQQSPD